MAFEFKKSLISGAWAGGLLYSLTWLLSLLVKPVATVSFSAIQTPLTAKIGIPGASLGGNILGLITGNLNLGQGIMGLFTAILGGAVAVLIGSFAFEMVHVNFLKGMLKIKQAVPKNQVNRLAWILFHSGWIAGLIISRSIGIPAFGTMLTLALSSVVTAYILFWLIGVINKQKLLKTKVMLP